MLSYQIAHYFREHFSTLSFYSEKATWPDNGQMDTKCSKVSIILWKLFYRCFRFRRKHKVDDFLLEILPPENTTDIEINRLEQIVHLLGHQTEQRLRVTYALISNWARPLEKWKLPIDNKKIFVEIKTQIEYFKQKYSFDFECFRAKKEFKINICTVLAQFQMSALPEEPANHDCSGRMLIRVLVEIPIFSFI